MHTKNQLYHSLYICISQKKHSTTNIVIGKDITTPKYINPFFFIWTNLFNNEPISHGFFYKL